MHEVSPSPLPSPRLPSPLPHVPQSLLPTAPQHPPVLPSQRTLGLGMTNRIPATSAALFHPGARHNLGGSHCLVNSAVNSQRKREEGGLPPPPLTPTFIRHFSPPIFTLSPSPIGWSERPLKVESMNGKKCARLSERSL